VDALLDLLLVPTLGPDAEVAVHAYGTGAT